MIVMAIGLLGLASLQAVSLTRGNDSLLRQQAAMLAYDIADRMRANLGGVRDPANGDRSSYHMTDRYSPHHRQRCSGAGHVSLHARADGD